MEVFVTPRAERHFESIVDYIQNKWGEKTASQFIEKADEIFDLLKSFPAMGHVEMATSGDFNFRLAQEYFTELSKK